MSAAEDFHATHSATIAAGPIDECWYCGRERAICKRKIWYPAEQVAAQLAADMPCPAEAYDCPWCDGFHITTRVRRATQAGGGE